MTADVSALPISLQALGTTIDLRCDNPVVRRQLIDLLQPLTAPVDPDRSAAGITDIRLQRGRANLLRRTVSTGVRMVAEAEVGATLTRVNAELITQMRYFGVHGAVLGSAGGIIAIPGTSGAGKSTATASALQAGFTYLSDEVVAVHWDSDDSWVVPYPRPLALSAWSRNGLGICDRGPERHLDAVSDELYISPAVLTSRIERHGGPLRHIVLLGSYSDRTRLRQVRRSEAAAGLLSHAFNAWQDPAAAFRVAHRLSSSSTCWVLDRSAAIDTGVVLRDHFGISGE